MAITRDTVEGWYVNGALTNKAQIDNLWARIQSHPVAWTVAVELEGYSEDRIETYVVITASEAEAIELGEREAKADYPHHTLKEGTEAYRLGLSSARVLGRLVPEDER